MGKTRFVFFSGKMAAFEKFVRYATLPGYDVIAFDTAPTGHTLRLLALPLDWDRQLEIMVALRPESEEYAATKARYENVIATLRDPGQTTFIFVVYPENTPIMEAYRASRDLAEAGIPTGLVAVNQVLREEVCTTPFFQSRFKLQQKYLCLIEEKFGVPTVTLPLYAEEIKGLTLLREAGKSLWGAPQKDIIN